jgi:hypothetical protein
MTHGLLLEQRKQERDRARAREFCGRFPTRTFGAVVPATSLPTTALRLIAHALVQT